MATQEQIQAQIVANKKVYQSLTQPVKMIDLRPDEDGNGGFVKLMEELNQRKNPDYKTPKTLDFQFADIFSKTVITETSDKKPKIVGWHGSNYKLITNEEMIKAVVKELNGSFGKGGYQMKGYVHDDRQMSCQFIINNETIGLPNVSKKDQISLMLSIENSYDGRIKPSNSASVGFYRQICTNGLHAFVMESKHSDNKRKHNESFFFSLAGIQEQIKNAESYVEKFKKLRERSLTVKEQEELFEEMAKNNIIQVRKLDEAKTIFQSEMAELNESGNAWLAYNAFNNIINHSYANETFLPETKAKIDKQVLNFITDRFNIDLN